MRPSTRNKTAACAAALLFASVFLLDIGNFLGFPSPPSSTTTSSSRNLRTDDPRYDPTNPHMRRGLYSTDSDQRRELASSWWTPATMGGQDILSIKEILDKVVMPRRLAWNERKKRYLYEAIIVGEKQQQQQQQQPTEDIGEAQDIAGETTETNQQDEEDSEGEAEEEDVNDPRPLMHTFFDAINSKGLEDELALVAAWETAWQSAGWRTKVLSGEDARRHPRYDELWALIDAMPLIQYDKLCYLRWLAMASVGGGWMSDYDTIPLVGSLERAVDLSYRPTFTVYGQNLSGDAVPALLSGSESEWNRMADALIKLGPHAVSMIGKFPFPSDMYSLMSLQYSPEVEFHVENDLMRGQDAFFSLEEGPSQSLCAKLNYAETYEGQKIPQWRAIHFSHAALMDVNVGFNAIASYRPKFALRWNALYRHNCMGEGMPSYPEDEAEVAKEQEDEKEVEVVEQIEEVVTAVEEAEEATAAVKAQTEYIASVKGRE